MTSDQQMRGGVNTPPRKILIMGVGNLLLTDDGFGVHVINSLNPADFPGNVTLLEAGTVSHQLIPMFRELDMLIVIDAVEAGDTPGSVFRFTPDDLQFKCQQKLSLHQISLIDVLRMAELTGGKPETIIIAVQPKDVTTPSMELSAEIKALIPKVTELIFQELKKANVL
jgi:hydrogenase maturation protease